MLRELQGNKYVNPSQVIITLLFAKVASNTKQHQNKTTAMSEISD